MWGTVNGPQTWTIDDDLFRKFCVLIHDVTGLSYGENSRFFLERRLETRIAALGGMTAYNYLQFLQYDPDRAQEWDLLIAVITTNETYFMREERQLRCFQKDILTKLGDRGGQKIRIWSAGCSSGEEPYTIAILIKELGRHPDDLFEIYATDINSKVLAKAKAGVYTESSFRAVDKEFKDRWFTSETAGQYKVRDTIHKMVTFTRFNLFDESRYSLLSPFDVIFCRNVIIYFDLEAKVKVVERFHDKLRNGGFLLLGHSESLISVTDKFKLVHLPLDLVYTKASP